MGIAKFTNFYNINEQIDVAKLIDEMEANLLLDEGLGDILKGIAGAAGTALTSLAGKAGLALLNNFSRTPKTTITLDFLKILVPLTPLKYSEVVGKLAAALTSGKKFGKRQNISIKELRQGVFIGTSNAQIEEWLQKSIPGVAVQSTNPELYASKIHKPEVYCYMTNPAGKISIFNMPKEETEVDSKYDAKNRVYAIGMNGGGNKCFIEFMGMPFKSWVTTQQITGKDEEYKAEQDLKKKPMVVVISKETYEKLIPKSQAETVNTTTSPTPAPTAVA